MKSKKGKALAMKLIDDLMGDDGEETSKQQEQTHSQEDQAKEKTSVSAESNVSDEGGNEESVVASRSLFSDESNPFGAEKSEGSELGNIENTSATEENDATIKISESKIIPVPTDDRKKVAASDSTILVGSKKKRELPENSVTGITSSAIKTSVGRYAGAGGISSPAQTTLVQSENLRVAQQKILELEEEISRLRTENEDLAAAGETLRRMSDEATAGQEALERKLESVKDFAQQEQQLMRESVETKERKNIEMQNKVEEMELRLSTNIQKIRVRERELENRLELVRMEGEALARSKDEMVLDLKRQVDQLNIELENYRSKGQELNSQIKDKQELLRRTVKALRLALSMLEGDEDMNFSLKKVK